MKNLITALTVTMLFLATGCSTVGGAVEGFGTDVKRGTDYLSGKISPKTQNEKPKFQ